MKLYKKIVIISLSALISIPVLLMALFALFLILVKLDEVNISELKNNFEEIPNVKVEEMPVNN
ncbi:MAG: hypothetical protein LBJ31_06345 [Treponema sp.]|nr:hypothetical protein [Treponema sp.]